MTQKALSKSIRAKPLSCKNSSSALRERVKELACLYKISQISDKFALDSDKVFQGIVEVIPSAWQHPEAAAARIVVDEKSYQSSRFAENSRKMSAPVILRGEHRGVVEVVYTKCRTTFEEKEFLREERKLLKAIARQIASITERFQAESEKNELQKQLIHADRLATIGQLAAGVAHELNEPLSTILGFAQLVLKDTALPQTSAHDLDRIVEASLYAREIIKKLLLFARQTHTFRCSISFNDMVSEALGLFEYRLIKDSIELKKKFSPDLPLLFLDGGQMKQVIVNLVANALQAMPCGGVLSVCTKTDDQHIVCRIEDTGTGMNSEVIENIFVPFFTTKDVEQGTGLGLSVVHGIVTSHGGTISVESSPGKGTVFTMRLPVEPVLQEKVKI